MPITTGYDFHGYVITDYLGIFSGECVLGTGFVSELSASFSDLFGTTSDAFSEKLEKAKEHALDRLKRNCLAHDANAVIGVDFDYITFGNNMIGVVANGTAVEIRRSEQNENR